MEKTTYTTSYGSVYTIEDRATEMLVWSPKGESVSFRPSPKTYEEACAMAERHDSLKPVDEEAVLAALEAAAETVYGSMSDADLFAAALNPNPRTEDDDKRLHDAEVAALKAAGVQFRVVDGRTVYLRKNGEWK